MKASSTKLTTYYFPLPYTALRKFKQKGSRRLTPDRTIESLYASHNVSLLSATLHWNNEALHIPTNTALKKNPRRKGEDWMKDPETAKTSRNMQLPYTECQRQLQ